MVGEDIWMVLIDSGVFKGGLTLKEAEKVAERYQKGLCKHKDHRIHVEIKRDTTMIKEMDRRYRTAKAGEPQTHGFYVGS